MHVQRSSICCSLCLPPKFTSRTGPQPSTCCGAVMPTPAICMHARAGMGAPARVGICDVITGHDAAHSDVGLEGARVVARYLCSVGLLPLGLPSTDRFWSAAPQPWTSQKVWNGEDTERRLVEIDKTVAGIMEALNEHRHWIS